MPHYRSMYDNEHLGAWDLLGKDVTVTIAAVKPGQLVGEGGKKSRKPILSFDGKEKTMACNITNAKIIASMHGTDTTKWVGKKITLYPTTTSAFGQEGVDCIRVRPGVPQ